MQVILLKSINAVGVAGSVKEVADGYARNYLLPQGLARPASQEAVGAVAQGAIRSKQREATRQRERHRALYRLRERRIILTLRCRANEKGVLYSAVARAAVAEALSAAGHTVPPDAIFFPHSIKVIGTHPVTVRFAEAGEVTVSIHVTPSS